MRRSGIVGIYRICSFLSFIYCGGRRSLDVLGIVIVSLLGVSRLSEDSIACLFRGSCCLRMYTDWF